jgi:hypothetical protein
MANGNAFYKVVLNGRYQGQAVVNILYYRLGVEFIPGPLNFAGAEDLAFQIIQEIWTPTMKGLYPVEYVLENVTVYPYSTTFDLLFQMPYVLTVNEAGTQAGLPTNGPAGCAIVRFNLEPTSPLNGFFAPKSGYVALGPVPDANIDNTGHLVPAYQGFLQDIGDAMSQDLENLIPPAIFYPIRMKSANVAGVIRFISWADIASASVRSLASFRRSRQPEA